MDTKGHLINQPGLRAHSVDPDNNLMKRYVVAYHPPGGIGWIWERSFHTLRFAEEYWWNGKPNVTYRIIDTKDNDRVVNQDSIYYP